MTFASCSEDQGEAKEAASEVMDVLPLYVQDGLHTGYRERFPGDAEAVYAGNGSLSYQRVI